MSTYSTRFHFIFNIHSFVKDKNRCNIYKYIFSVRVFSPLSTSLSAVIHGRTECKSHHFLLEMLHSADRCVISGDVQSKNAWGVGGGCGWRQCSPRSPAWGVGGRRVNEVWCIVFILRITSSFFIFVVSWHICHLYTMHSVVYLIFYNIIVLSSYVKIIWLILMICGEQGGVLNIFFNPMFR